MTSDIMYIGLFDSSSSFFTSRASPHSRWGLGWISGSQNTKFVTRFNTKCVSHLL